MSSTPETYNSKEPELQALLALRRMKARLEELEQFRSEPIAIIGMGCRFPGDVHSPEEFWKLLCNAEDAITDVPEERRKIWLERTMEEQEKQNKAAHWGGFLSGIDQFDASFFNVAPREAMYMDPQQRLLLEVCWEAFEHAGLVVEDLAGSKTGVFIGVCNSDYSHFQYIDSPYNDAYLTTGTAFSIVANRVSYLLDLRGPSITIDTACSSSLVALHLACQSLRNHECDVSIIGGVNLMLSPGPTEAFASWGMLADDGSCKTFDARADGFVRGEGCGVVIAKRLSKAKADGDPILAVVKGSAVNQDGHSNGLTAPNAIAQQEVIRQALSNAHLQAKDISYIETHGTGTALGDPVEIAALTEVYGQELRATSIVLGAVKTNIGHLEAAAGMAGLMKAILALQNKQIPPNLHFQSLNPHISFHGTPFVVPTVLQEWVADNKIRRAGLSAFGFGGTNAHIIIEEAPTSSLVKHQEQVVPSSPYLLPLSARSSWSLRALANRYRELLMTDNDVLLQDLCYSASVRREHHLHRLAVYGSSPTELYTHLTDFLADDASPGFYSGQRSIEQSLSLTFVFPGQGSQWLGMGKQLLSQEPVFRTALEQCEQAMRPYVDWSLLYELQCSEEQSQLKRIDVVQPALCAIQIALAALWKSWGIIPGAVIGHSMGEVAASYCAGILSLDDACRVICLRSRLLKKVSAQGAMVVVNFSLQQAQNALQGYEQSVALAVSNSPYSTVLSGDPGALAEIVQSLEQQQIFYRYIKVDVASHSPQMDQLRDELFALLSPIRPSKAQLPMYSTVTGALVSGEELDASYWVKNLRQPVLFFDTIQQAIREERTHFLELSPHPILTSSVEDGLHFVQKEGLVCSSLHREEGKEALLRTLAQLYVHGYTPDWRKLYPSTVQYVTLPTYCWQQQGFWVEANEQRSALARAQRDQPARAGLHPLLGTHLSSALQTGTHYWEVSLMSEDIPFLQDHRVQGQIVWPGAACLEMILAASMQVVPDETIVIKDIHFHTMLRFEEHSRKRLQLVLIEADTNDAQCHIYSREEGAEHASSPWNLHTTGVVCKPEKDSISAESKNIDFSTAEFQAQSRHTFSQERIYQLLQEQGLAYGPIMRGLQRVWFQDHSALAQLQYAENALPDSASYYVHPAILDACFQTFAVMCYAESQQHATYVPVSIEKCIFHVENHDLSVRELWVLAYLDTEAGVTSDNNRPETMVGKLQLFNNQAQLVLEVDGFRVQRLQQPVQADPWQGWFYELLWKQQQVTIPTAYEKYPSATWLVFADKQNIASRFIHYMEQRNQRCIVVERGEVYAQADNHYIVNPDQLQHLQQLLDNVSHDGKHPCAGIIHFWGLESSEYDDSVDSIMYAQERGCGSILHLTQMLMQMGWRNIPRLWLITQGAQPAGTPTLSPQSIAQSPIWGLGRTIALEYPQCNCSLIDISPNTTDTELEQELASLHQEIVTAHSENQIVLRGMTRYVARLTPTVLKPQAPLHDTLFHTQGCYLITGGLGGLGITIAQWMITKGARHLLLVTRSSSSATSSTVQEAIAALRETGVEIEIVYADVAQEKQVAQLLQDIESKGLLLRGIIHAAGVLDDATLPQQSIQHFKRVMAAKIAGAWNLHQLTLQSQLDFFVLFSSAATLMGSPGQGNYTAANSFLDALAYYRHAQGLSALSLNWGPWTQVGLAARADLDKRLAFQGVAGIAPQDGLATFELALMSAVEQVAIMPFDVRRWYQIHPVAVRLPLLESLLQQVTLPGGNGQAKKSFGSMLSDLRSNVERRALLEETLWQQVALALRLSPADIDQHVPLHALGMDSMMSVELKNRIESQLDLTFSSTLLWAYPTIAKLTAYLATELGIAEDTHEPIENKQESDVDTKESFTQIGQYSEDDLLLMLEEELNDLGKRNT